MQKKVSKFAKGFMDFFNPQANPMYAGEGGNMDKILPYFAEKRCVITGSSSGIGRAVAIW
jgi:hypothetical protein